MWALLSLVTLDRAGVVLAKPITRALLPAQWVEGLQLRLVFALTQIKLAMDTLDTLDSEETNDIRTSTF